MRLRSRLRLPQRRSFVRPTIACCAVAFFFGMDARRADAQENPFSNCSISTMRAQGSTTELIPERPGAIRYRRTGTTMNPVVIACDDTTVQSNEMTYDDDTRLVEAVGDVVLQQGNLTLFAERAVMNRDTKLGTFYRATGFARITDEPAERSQFGTVEPDVYFFGEEVSKTGPTTYLLRRGGFTTCVQPTPRWEMTTSTGTITLDKRAVLRNVVLKVKDVPLFYLPAIYYPIDKEGRSTGFLMPQYGAEGGLGTRISNAFFWAIDRSQDATFYHDWFSKSGPRYGTEYRYVRSSDSQGKFEASFSDDSPPTSVVGEDTDKSSYNISGYANQGLPRGFRLVGNIDYFSKASQQQYQQGYTDSTENNRSFHAELSGMLRRVRVSALVQQTDTFNFTEEQDETGTFWNEHRYRTGRRPSLTISMPDRPIGRTRVYYGAGGEVTSFVHRPDLANDALDLSLSRFDGGPAIRGVLSTLPFLNATATASWRLTYWSQTWDELNGRASDASLARQLVTLSLQTTGPIFSRVFQTPDSRYADRLKHIIEPTFSLSRTSAFTEIDRVIWNDHRDGERGGTTTINYGLRNRLLARRVQAQGVATPAPVREILTVSLSQRYYTDALAQVSDPNNYFGTPGNFSPLELTASFRPVDYASTDFGMYVDPKHREVRDLTLGGRLDHPNVGLHGSWSKRFEITGLPSYEAANTSNYLNTSTTMKFSGNRVGWTYQLNYDIKRTTIVNQRVIGYYNSQCCGLSFSWQSYDSPILGGANNRLALSFTLAGVGSFSNPFGSFGAQ